MSLHSMHKAALEAKHKTAASLRSVFTSHGKGNASPSRSFRRKKSTTQTGGSERRRGRSEPPNGQERHSEAERDRLLLSEDPVSDDEAYFTAFEEIDNDGRLSRESSLTSSDDLAQTITQEIGSERSSTKQEYDTVPEKSGGGSHHMTGSARSSSKQEFKTISEESEGGSHHVTGSRRSPSGADNPHLQLIKQLREKAIKSTSDKHREKLDDATLLRFLIARNMDLGRATDMLVKDLKWRDEIMPLGYIAESSVVHQLEAEKVFLQGLDRQGRPLMIVIGSKHFSKGRDLEEFKRYVFYCIEKTIASMPEGKEKFVTIVDLGATGYKNMDISATLTIVDFLQAHYPERLGQLFVVNVPSMFNMSYKLIEGAIDIKTREKIFVLVEDINMVLKREIGDECLPKAYGGKFDFVPIQKAMIDRSSFPCSADPSR